MNEILNNENESFIIEGKYIIPIIPKDTILNNHSIIIKNNIIIDILPWESAFIQYKTLKIINKRNHILIPGLINAHTHAALSLLRGLADDKPLCEWLNEDIWPAEATFLSKEFVKDGSYLAIAEMIRSGTTCFNDMYYYAEETEKICNKIGIRSVLGQLILEVPTSYCSTIEDYFNKANINYLNNKKKYINKLVHISIAPHAPYTVNDIHLIKIKEISENHKIRIHIHLHETHSECNDSEQLVIESMTCHKSTYPSRPIQNLDRLGLISDKLICVHMTQLNDKEINLIANAKSHVVHCPTSNLKLASGICPITKLMEKGVNVALGTDSACSNNSLNMFFEMKLAAILAKNVSTNGETFKAFQTVEMATINGAKALGIDHLTGSLEIGKCADIVAVSIDSIEMQPLYSAISHLVYVSSRENVTDVWINGQHVLDNRKLTTIDEEKVKIQAYKWYEKIKKFHDTLVETSKIEKEKSI